MSCSIKRHSNCEHTSNSHHVHQGAKSKMDITMNILEKVSAVALGAFSLYTSWKLFTPFFAIGLAIGAYNYFQNRKTCHHQAPGSACSEVFRRFFTGLSFQRLYLLLPTLPLLFAISITMRLFLCLLSGFQWVLR